MTTYVVTLKGSGVELARSSETQSVEGNVYFPPSSIVTDLFSDSPTPYTCAWKGAAQYHNLSKDGDSIKDIAWSYDSAKDRAANINKFWAFDKSKVEIQAV